MTWTVEQEAIAVASAYAVANGYDPDDRRAVGLVLAGMAIVATASSEAQVEVYEGYVRQFPEAEAAIRGWTERLSRWSSSGYTGAERRVQADPDIPQWEERRGRP